MKIESLILVKNYGFKIGNINISEKLYNVVKALEKMENDNIIKHKFHFDSDDNKTIKLDTYGMRDKHIKELKEILKNKGFYIEENSCYHWLNISEEKDSLKKYFD